MKNCLAVILLVLFNLLNVPLLIKAQNAEKVDAVKYFDDNKRWHNQYTEHWFHFHDIPEEEIRNSIIQWEQIGKDLENVKQEWAGTFASGSDTHGDYFRWSEKSGFVWLSVNKCRGGPMQVIRGSVVASSSQIQLLPEHITGSLHHSKHQHTQNYKPIDLLFVEWHGVPILVQKTNLTSFADYAAGLGEYNGYFGILEGTPFLRKFGVESTDNFGELPIFPAGYEKFVKKPIKGKIIKIGKSFRQADPDSEDWENLVTQVSVDIGKADGGVPNLQLFFVDSESDFQEEIKIKKVYANSSITEIVRSVRKKNCLISEESDCKDSDYSKINVGLKLSTTGF